MKLGCPEKDGAMDGPTDGTAVGFDVGNDDGTPLGVFDNEGRILGIDEVVGKRDGYTEGAMVGSPGSTEGKSLG